MTLSVLHVCLVVMAASIGLALIRLLRGPTVADRIIALDLLGIVTVATIGLVCIEYNDAAFLDAAVVLAIITFLVTVAFSRYLERRLKGE